MREEDLSVRKVKKQKFNSYLGEISPAVENIINRDFHAEKPNEKWLKDITEFHIPAGKVYLSPIIDCFDGLPVSWTIGTSPNAELANTMLDEAIVTLKDDEKPISPMVLSAFLLLYWCSRKLYFPPEIFSISVISSCSIFARIAFLSFIRVRGSMPFACLKRFFIAWIDEYNTLPESYKTNLYHKLIKQEKKLFAQREYDIYPIEKQ